MRIFLDGLKSVAIDFSGKIGWHGKCIYILEGQKREEKMKKVKLIEEVSPEQGYTREEIEKGIWNSPPAGEVCMKAETVLRRLKKMLVEMSDKEYERLMDITADNSADFLCLGVATVQNWVEKCADKATIKKAT